jgi:nucleoid-associated protein YgaU
VKISTWIKLPVSPKASTDGALFYDSAGGEPLAVRLTNPTGWKQFTLYREVPDTGRINVTLAMTGIGAVYFDDVKIEPLIAKGAPATPAPVPPSGAIASNATK